MTSLVTQTTEYAKYPAHDCGAVNKRTSVQINRGSRCPLRLGFVWPLVQLHNLVYFSMLNLVTHFKHKVHIQGIDEF